MAQDCNLLLNAEWAPLGAAATQSANNGTVKNWTDSGFPLQHNPKRSSGGQREFHILSDVKNVLKCRYNNTQNIRAVMWKSRGCEGRAEPKPHCCCWERDYSWCESARVWRHCLTALRMDMKHSSLSSNPQKASGGVTFQYWRMEGGEGALAVCSQRSARHSLGNGLTPLTATHAVTHVCHAADFQ